MNAVLLSPCVMPMPIAKTLSALTVVPVNLDLLETGKRALVRSKVYRISYLKKKIVFRIGASPGFFSYDGVHHCFPLTPINHRHFILLWMGC